MQPGSAFMTAATCSLSSAASASPLPLLARIFAITVSTSAIGPLSFRAPALGMVIRAAQPAQRVRHVLGARHVHLDPAAAREPPVRARTDILQRPRLVDGAQTDPEVVVLLAERKAR